MNTTQIVFGQVLEYQVDLEVQRFRKSPPCGFGNTGKMRRFAHAVSLLGNKGGGIWATAGGSDFVRGNRKGSENQGMLALASAWRGGAARFYCKEVRLKSGWCAAPQMTATGVHPQATIPYLEMYLNDEVQGHERLHFAE
jgi:hypothetical protein